MVCVVIMSLAKETNGRRISEWIYVVFIGEEGKFVSM